MPTKHERMVLFVSIESSYTIKNINLIASCVLNNRTD